MNKIQENEYQRLKNLLSDRDYRIGLDLGVGSIGYCVVALDKHQDENMLSDIILLGSRIFKSSIGAVDRRIT